MEGRERQKIMNQNQRNSVIAKNEQLNPPEHHDYNENCDCPNCEDERVDRCPCGAELKPNEFGYCKDCI